MNNNLLTPGESIKVKISDDIALAVLEAVFGLKPLKYEPLDCYDDLNFYIKETLPLSNACMGCETDHGYMLKFLNYLDSSNVEYVEAQNEMMKLLLNDGIQCPEIIPNKYNEEISIIELIESEPGFQILKKGESVKKTHIVRLFKYLPGTTLGETKAFLEHTFEAGILLGKINLALKNFHNEPYKQRKTIWMLESFPLVENFLQHIPCDTQKIVKDVIRQFQNQVVPQYGYLRKGFLHGDFNERNILVDGSDHVYGVIDFGDSQYSYYLFDIAIGITYQLLINSNTLEVYNLFLEGYETIIPLLDLEHKLLKTCIAARLCQSLVLGASSFALDPSNEYLLSSSKRGWQVLEYILNNHVGKFD